MKQGLIVLMNGTSSAGKTSISMELMNQKEILFHHLSVDDFIKDFFNHKFSDIEPTREVDEQVIAQIMFDPLISMYYSTIKLLSEMGLNVIVDTVIENDKSFNECLDLFFNQPTLFIGVICSKEELIRREQIRGDRNIGLAASQFSKVYSIDEYDLEVNTEEMNPTECAEKILSFMKSDQHYSAFKKLSKRDISGSLEGVSIR
ncbi:chloramphenicol phosphotransferase CPT family protein [Paenibacillus sp. XY044]|uniref:chloramphenicol phosphotransferase CPT family protein n=1 Tax=Paenibacillus sp. XY044 TaxID=2026089 RepID=UPI000B98F089|nr:AAA family ATPase [Paenibacillus sp. XY044]OZB94098.1 chemotaxis protein [Paenibacillus sp. XY044]